MKLFKYEKCPKCKGEILPNLEPCETCDEQGELRVEIQENEIVYVNVYYVTREFGGHEEGGWYYENYQCVESIPVKLKHAELMQSEATKDYEGHKHGDISSVLGGLDVRVAVEDKRCKSETKEKPIYE